MERLIEPNTTLIFNVHLYISSPNERIIRATTINDLIRVVTLHATAMASGSPTYLMGCGVKRNDHFQIKTRHHHFFTRRYGNSVQTTEEMTMKVFFLGAYSDKGREGMMSSSYDARVKAVSAWLIKLEQNSGPLITYRVHSMSLLTLRWIHMKLLLASSYNDGLWRLGRTFTATYHGYRQSFKCRKDSWRLPNARQRVAWVLNYIKISFQGIPHGLWCRLLRQLSGLLPLASYGAYRGRR